MLDDEAIDEKALEVDAGVGAELATVPAGVAVAAAEGSGDGVGMTVGVGLG